MAGMKWWGWGRDDIAFTHEDKPELGPFIQRHLGLDVGRRSSSPVGFGALDVPEPELGGALRAALEEAGVDISTDRTTASSTPAARACATSCATAAGTSGGCPTPSSARAARPKWRPSCRRCWRRTRS